MNSSRRANPRRSFLGADEAAGVVETKVAIFHRRAHVLRPVQTDLDRLLIRLIPGPGYGQKEAQHLVREFKARLGDDMRIDIELVESLPRTSRGKFKWVTSLVELGL